MLYLEGRSDHFSMTCIKKTHPHMILIIHDVQLNLKTGGGDEGRNLLPQQNTFFIATEALHHFGIH